MKQFVVTEKTIIDLFPIDSEFSYDGIAYKVIECGKPSPSKGECKTDIYILGESESGNKEFKISVKQTNADFLENKMKIDRVREIFGDIADHILTSSLEAIREKFNASPLIYFKQKGHTDGKSIKIGWRFELLNKPGGELSGELLLDEKQLLDVYGGTNLPAEKKNCYVNGKKIDNSGIAEYILIVDHEVITKEFCMSNIIPLSEYVKGKKVYFVCKAVNYRCEKDKWEGDRSLSVYVDWSIKNEKLCSKLVFDKPLLESANSIGKHIQSVLKTLNISSDNFDDLKQLLDDSVNIYE